MGRVVLLDAQKALPVSFSGALMETLETNGWRVCLARQATDLAAGDTLLVLGIADWAAVGKPFFSRARELGIQRILWSCEPLLPPDLPSSRLQNWFLHARGVDYASRAQRMQRLFDRFAYYGFAIQSWSLPWNKRRDFLPRQFSYAAKESRRLLGFWRAGLVDTLFVSLEPRQTFLAGHGVPSLFVPVGYHPDWGSLLEETERDIDVVFLGNITRRRRALLQDMEQALEKAGFTLKVVNQDCYGDVRTQLLNRSKILLNLNTFPWESPGMRMLMAMSCKAMVVSEHAENTAPYIEGTHFRMAARNELVDLVVSCLKDEAGRLGIADQAYRYVTEENTLANVMRMALESPSGAARRAI